MKKSLLSILATLSIAVILPAAAFADNTSTISGTITNASNSPLSGASVTVICAGHQSLTTSGAPLAAGDYSVTFPTSKCPPGHTVSVSATFDGKTGTNSGTLTSSNQDLNINVATVNVQIDIVPELGAITGASAAVLGGAAFMVIRHKHLKQN